MRVRSVALAAVAAVAAVTAVSLIVESRARPAFGVSATYFSGLNWSGHVRVRTIDGDISTERLDERWPWIEEPFSVRWEGYLLIDRDGPYRIGTLSDDGSWVFLDGEIVVDNGGNHEPHLAQAERFLARGLHPLKVEYFQNGGGREINLLIAPRGERLAPVRPSTLLSTSVSDAVLARWRARATLRNLLLIVTTPLYVTAALFFMFVVPLKWLIRRELPHGLPFAVVWFLVAVTAVYGFGIWWGLDSRGGTWAPDELTPDEITTAVDARFANGWTHKYPPGHFYVISAVSAPALVSTYFDRSTDDNGIGDTAVLMIARVISLVMGVGTVLLFYLCARRLMAPAASFIAAAVFAATAPMVYYAKVANVDVPYLYWAFMAFLAYVHLLERPSRTDYVMFACAAVAAICTKDQAYGLFLLPALAILVRHYRSTPGARVSDRLRRSILGRDVLAAAACAVILFAVLHNIVFNAAGFVQHLRDITGAESQSYRIFSPDLPGQWRMFDTTVWLIVHMLTPAVLALSVVGAAAAWRGRRDGNNVRLLMMGLVPVSYYLTVIAVIGYNYDRFLIPVCAVLALFAGLAGSLVWQARWPSRAVTAGAMLLCVGFTALRAVAVDIAMAMDSRYAVQQWASANIGEDKRIGMIGLPEYLPHVHDVIGSRPTPPDEELRALSSDIEIVNPDYARRFRTGSEEEQAYRRLRDGTAGYRLAFSPPAGYPLSSISYATRLGERGLQLSNLTKIDPPLLVFERVKPR